MDSQSPITFNGDSPLHVAVRQGQVEDVKEILSQQQVDVNILNSKQETPLHLACSKGDSAIVQLLVAFGADPYVKDSNNRNAYSRGGFCIDNLMNELLYSHDFRLWIDGRIHPDKENSLHTAVRLERLDDIQRIIEKKIVDINDTNANRETPLHLACTLGHKRIVYILISNGADIYKKDYLNNAPIHRAVSQGYIDTVDYLITDCACNPHIKGYQDRTLLHFACGTGKFKMVTTLIEKYGVSPMVTDAVNQAPLHIAASHDQKEVLCLLITKYSLVVDCRSNYKLSPLHLACYCGHVSIVNTLLLQYKADLNAHDESGSTPFLKAALGGNSVLVELMITYFNQNPLSVTDDSGNTPLHLACLGGHAELARLLINKYNCPIDVKNVDRQTPLHLACSRGHLDVSKVVLSECMIEGNKRFYNALDKCNNTPLDLSIKHGNAKVVHILSAEYGLKTHVRGAESKPLLHQLAAGGFTTLLQELISRFNYDPACPDEDGNTILHTAAQHGQYEVAKFLMAHHSNRCAIDHRNSHGQTALHCACISGDTRMAKFLVANKADITDSRGFKKQSLLHHALANGHTSTAKTLIEDFHLSLHCIDEDGNTPLHLSSLAGQTESVRLLLYEYHAPLYVRNKAGKTALDLATEDSTKKVIREYANSEHKRIQHEYEELRAKSIHKYSGQQVITRVFVLGNSGSGKSTLVESLKRKGIISSLFAVTEADVPPHTAGIIPSVHHSKEAGRLLYYDFAGDQEYYSSHAAILEMVSRSTVGGNVFLIVANLTKYDAILQDEIGYWLSFISYHGKALDSQCKLKVIVVLSHIDRLSVADSEWKLESARQFLYTHINQCNEVTFDAEIVSSNCRSPRSSRSVASILHQISKDTPPCSISYEASLLHGILEKDFGNVIACKFHELLSSIMETIDIFLPTSATALYPTVKELHDVGLLMLIGQNEDELEDYILLLNSSSLTNEVHEILFSNSAVKQLRCTIGPHFANMGILPESYLSKLLPEHITKECLVQLQYCQEFTCADVGLDSSGVSNSVSEKNLLYFPALCKLDHEQSNWPTDPLLNFSIGWYAKCTGKFDYFPARFLHVLLLRLAFAFALRFENCNITEINKIQACNRRCTMWKNGIHWIMEEGVECIFEMVNDNKGIVIITKSEEGSKEWAGILSVIISKTMQAKTEFCSTVSLYHFLLKSDDISSFKNEDKLFKITEIEHVINDGKEKVVSVSGRRFFNLSQLDILFKEYNFGGLCDIKGANMSTLSHSTEVEYDVETQLQPVEFENKKYNDSQSETGSKPQVYISADPVNQLYGDKITLTADVVGLSVGLYQWLKNNKNLSIEKYPACDGLGTNKLTISPFIHAYEGKYQCAVTFSGGQVVKSNHIELVLGNILTERDIRILAVVLAKHLPYLQNSGLNLKQGVRITKEEVVIHLRKIDRRELAEILSEDKGVEHLQYYFYNNVYKKALRDAEHDIVNLQVFRMVLCGVPRSGKTTFWRRIAIKDYNPSQKSPSTGAAESHYISAVGREKQKSGQKSRAHVHAEMLFDLHLYNKDGDLDSEALTIYKLILERYRPKPESQTSIPIYQDKSETHKPQDELQTSKHEIQASETQMNLKANKPAADNENTQPSGSSGIQKGLSAALPSLSKTVSKKQPVAPDPDPIIAEINKHINELNLLLTSKDLPDLPNIKKMCHLQDTAGQRAFLELLPTLSRGKALYLLFFNYDSFEKSVFETRQAEGNSEELPTGIEFEQINVIMQSLICISTASEVIQSTVRSQPTESLNNVGLLVGTHVDKVTSEDVTRVDAIIYERVKPFLENCRLVQAESGGKECVVLKVAINENKLCSNKPEDYVDVIMNIVENELKCKESEELPASWYMFCIMIRRLQSAGYSILRYSHCQQIAKELYIQQSALKSLLFRLHDVFGIVHYFPEVKALEDIVVCDPAFVYNSISKLIFESFRGRCDVSLLNKLQKHGIFKFKELQKHCKTKQDLELSKLMILLKHLGVIAPIKCSNTNQIEKSEYEDKSDNEDVHPDQEYVIPCILMEAKQHELNVKLKNTQACSIVPVRIYFACGFTPLGGFCYLFTKLISNNKGWELCTPDLWEDENHIYWRNKVTLKVKLDSHHYLVTLLSTDEYYEVHIIHSVCVSNQPFQLQNDGHSICKHVWKAIHSVLEKSPNKCVQAYKVACICTIENNKHVMTFECKPHENLPNVKAYCKECSCHVPVDTQPSVMVWFKTPHKILHQTKIGGKVHLCNLLFKTEDGRKPPKCKLWLDDKKISEADERYRVEYKADIEMFRVSISDFKSELKGVYECVVSTAEEPTVSTAVEVVISYDRESRAADARALTDHAGTLQTESDENFYDKIHYRRSHDSEGKHSMETQVQPTGFKRNVESTGGHEVAQLRKEDSQEDKGKLLEAKNLNLKSEASAQELKTKGQLTDLSKLKVVILVLLVLCAVGYYVVSTLHNHHTPRNDKVENLNALIQAVKDIGNWRGLCTNLGVSEGVIDTLIYSTTTVDIKKADCLLAYFNGGEANWGDVVKAVAMHPISNKRVAKQIAKTHGLDYSNIVKEEL